MPLKILIVPININNANARYFKLPYTGNFSNNKKLAQTFFNDLDIRVFFVRLKLTLIISFLTVKGPINAYMGRNIRGPNSTQLRRSSVHPIIHR